MDELGWSWPAWKFGMKREDLTTKLHDQYNTFPSSIQDPEAFHHDVYEISHEASSTDEFHHMMAARKQQRLQELSDSLEAAAFEIIAHPKLIGTEQWQYALQLFRTRSLDSLVRYFSSYLYPTPPSPASSAADASSVGTASTNPSTVDDNDHHHHHDAHVPTFLAKEGKASFTHEPQELHDATFISLNSKIPLSSRSMTMKSDTTASSQSDISTHDFALSRPPTPPRTLSFSGSEAESVPALAKSLSDDDDDTSQSEADSPAASEPDLMESRSSLESLSFSGSESGHLKKDYHYNDDEEDIPSAQMPADSFFSDDFETVQVPLESCEPVEAETPTPRQEAIASCYIDSKSLHQHHPYRTRSPNRSESSKSTRLPRRDVTPPGMRRSCISRRSPEEVFSRIQKPPLPDPARIRARGRIAAARLG